MADWSCDLGLLLQRLPQEDWKMKCGLEPSRVTFCWRKFSWVLQIPLECERLENILVVYDGIAYL